MKKIPIILFTLSILTLISCSSDKEEIQEVVVNVETSNIWEGPTVVFSKDDGADFTQESNQDRITSNVWITRAVSYTHLTLPTT